MPNKVKSAAKNIIRQAVYGAPMPRSAHGPGVQKKKKTDTNWRFSVRASKDKAMLKVKKKF